LFSANSCKAECSKGADHGAQAERVTPLGSCSVLHSYAAAGFQNCYSFNPIMTNYELPLLLASRRQLRYSGYLYNMTRIKNQNNGSNLPQVTCRQ
jgi:hypothetical protein